MTQRIIDFSQPKRCWDHDYAITEIKKGGRRIKGHMWVTPGPKVGDLLILPNPKPGAPDQTACYEVTKTHWTTNVDDMYFFTAKFAPREEP